ncbi:MAG: AraC family transcriptional regulator [Lachnospiraceae bacterium]|nr:AraC family transcriptional regulator [Lachnospiraceae bacterium]MDE6184008.1 AraC family transcriptional regulator [Lachnospiraceae bacterium]MDE7286053.1 AraC family transcriptional regulator [Lachnospiraceae bacterium]
MNREKENIVKKIADYVEAHLAEDLSLDKIAEELHYSKFYMARIFAESTGITIYKYVQGRRLTAAARQLVESDRAITDIAYDAHYHSQQAFTLAFRTLYGCPPQNYRKNGVFYPKQTKISMCHSLCLMAAAGRLKEGRMAA